MTIHDQEAEQLVLGSLLQGAESFEEVSGVLRPEDFYFQSHQLIYESISHEVDKGAQPDMLLVIANLKSKNALEKVGSRSYLAEIVSSGSAVSALAYAKRVKDLSLRRSLLGGIREIEKSLGDPSVSLEELLSKTEKTVFQVSDRHSEYNVRHVREINEEFVEYLKQLKASEGGVTGVATGFTDLDQITTGFKGGQLIVLAARPGIGKTTLALNMAQNMIHDQRSPAPVLLFSLEMTSIELLLRMVCSDAYLDSGKIQKGFINDREMKKIYDSCSRIYSSEFYIDDSPELNSWELKQRARRLASHLKAQEKKLGLIIVDYLQLMTEASRMENRQVEVASISRGLKAIAKELDVSVLAVSQMNRSVEQRGKDHRPQLSDLRESGAIEQDADIVMFIHREEVYNKDLPESEKGMAELIVAKHRAGPTGLVSLAFAKEKNRFFDGIPDREASPEGEGPLMQ